MVVKFISTSQNNDVPSPFPIPTFRQSMKNLEKGLLITPDRRYIVQTIATVLMIYVQWPSLDCCNDVAKSVIDKYPFLKDTVGGQVSTWGTDYIILCSICGLKY